MKKRHLLLLSALILLATYRSQAAIYISEFMAANKSTIQDEDGDHSDWIEIYNTGPLRVDLTNWALTDESTNLFKWTFPKVALLADEYLLVFASAKDRTNNTTPLHANFKLSKNGGYLALVDSRTNIVSEFPAYPAQTADVSYGRDRVIFGMTGFFSHPTPGKPNAIEGTGVAPGLQFSQVSETFVNPFTLTLTADYSASNSVIRYTTNSALPGTNSFVYTGPLTITNTTVIRARVFADGLLPGPPHTESFIALNTNALNFTSDLPVVIIHTLGTGRIGQSVDQFAYMGLFEPRSGRSSLTNRPMLSTQAGVKIRGSSTAGLPKSSWAVQFNDEFSSGRNLSPLDLPAESDWVLYAPDIYEPVLIHNPFIYTMSRAIGHYSSRTRFVEVFLVNGPGLVSSNNYNGLYVLEEKIKQGKDRVNIDKLHPADETPPAVTGGYMLKIDRPGPGETGITAGGQTMVLVDPSEADIKLPQRAPQLQYLKDYFNAFGKALTGPNWRDPNLGYAAYIDVDTWINYHILEVLSGNVDTLVLSSYFYKPRSGKVVYGPHWDFDRALGSTDGRDVNPRTWNTGSFFFATWWAKLLSDPAFWQKWVDRWQELRKTQFSNVSINGLIDSLTGEILDAQPREKARWRVALKGNSYQLEVNAMKNWLSNRMDFIDKQLVQPPVFNAGSGMVDPGFVFSISAAANATIFYTLDGTDPRLAQGDVSPSALQYSAPLQVSQNVRVTARARNLLQKQTGGPPYSTPWSGLAAETFITDPLPLVITEIMYHPKRSSGAKTDDGGNYAFIEIKNVGKEAISLKGVRFTKGILFDFTNGSITNLPPGALAVVVQNRTNFSSRYGAVPNIAGEYTGSLDFNAGELTLTGPSQETLLDFSYHHDWQQMTDGLGFSLVPVNENVSSRAWGDSESWRASSRLNGSPGVDDPTPVSFPPIVISEVLSSSPARIELYNPTDSSADISGWYLTDDLLKPQKFKIPTGVTLTARTNKVFFESDFNSGQGGSFLPSVLGGEIYLFSADSAGHLTGYSHRFPFGPTPPGQSYRRFLAMGGQELFRPALLNAAPASSPLIINEVMYRPPPFPNQRENLLDAFVEIFNNSTESIALYEPSAGRNTWRLSGDIAFSFPTNLTISPHGFVLVVSFDPQLDPGERNAFLAYYNLDPQISLLGPYSGRLNPAGQKLALRRPFAASDQPSGSLDVAVDELSYSTRSAWPFASDGTGFSLQRLSANLPGADTLNWISAPPTPGKLNGAGDGDADGLPDSWELAHNLNISDATGNNGALGDPDGDGLSNLEEYRAGTDPQNPASYLRIDSFIVNGVPKLTFLGIPGKSYSVLYADDFPSGPWLKLQDVSGPVEVSEINIIDPRPNPARARYYRLVSPMAP